MFRTEFKFPFHLKIWICFKWKILTVVVCVTIFQNSGFLEKSYMDDWQVAKWQIVTIIQKFEIPRMEKGFQIKSLESNLDYVLELF